MTLETYEKSVNILINAYRTGTLFHGSCSACAVGNLMGGDSHWRWTVGNTDSISGKSLNIVDGLPFENTTGMSIPELSKIERAFEMVIHNELLKKFTIEELSIPVRLNLNIAKIVSEYRMWEHGVKKKEGQYLGLCAVLDVMATMIDGPVENNVVDDNKIRLNKVAETFEVATI